MKTAEYLFKRVCTNGYKATTVKVVDGKPQKVPMEYRREDLSEWAKEAFNRGEWLFYAEPVNPDCPCGRLRLCEPKYKYELRKSLTVEEYELVVKAFEALNEKEEPNV